MLLSNYTTPLLIQETAGEQKITVNYNKCTVIANWIIVRIDILTR